MKGIPVSFTTQNANNQELSFGLGIMEEASNKIWVKFLKIFMGFPFSALS